MAQLQSLTGYLDVANQVKSGWTSYRSTDVDEIHEAVSGLICEHQMELGSSTSGLDYSHRLLRGEKVSVAQMTYGGTVHVRTRELSPYIIVTMPISGSTSYCCGEESGLATSTQGFLPKPDKEFAFGWNADCESLAIRIERHAIEQRLEELLGRPLMQTLDFDLEMPVITESGALWLSAVRDHIHYMEQRPNDPNGKWLLPEHEKLLLTTLLYTQPHNHSKMLRTSGDEAPQHVKIAEKYIEENAEKNINSNDLVILTGISEGALWRAFKRFRGCSPIQYLRFIRMKKTRLELLNPNIEGNVTEIAMRWGFYHLGRFALAYKKHFGESPSDTLKRRGI